MKRYFIKCVSGGVEAEREVTLEEYCKAERAAGFCPKLPSDHPNYMRTPATGGFTSGLSGLCGTYVTGRISYSEAKE